MEKKRIPEWIAFLAASVLIATVFLFAMWINRLWNTPESADIEVVPNPVPLYTNAPIRLKVRLYNTFGIEIPQQPQIELEIVEGRESIAIDSVYPGGAILRAADRPGTALLHIWIHGFPLPYEVQIQITSEPLQG